ncbi:MAG: oligopeptide ABC transporter permease [Caldilineaceae bacterium]|jgi:peptide/nickel transport system permease protein
MVAKQSISSVVVTGASATPSARWRVWRRFLRHRMAVVSALFLVLMILVTFPLAPLVTPSDPDRIDLKAIGKAPSLAHPLGTDLTGRDLWSRLVYGGRVSLSVGVVAVSIYVTLGVLLGSLAGYYGGRVDGWIMRFTEIVMAFPTLIILITIVAIVGPGLFNSMIAIGLIGWTGIARLVRGQILSLRSMDFVTAARAVGSPQRRILVQHILPNVVAPIIVAATFGIAGAILTEAGLSFLGLGIKPPTPSWGNMINEAQQLTVIESKPWIWLGPGLMITLSVLAINFIGDGLRDALDPRMTLD